MEVAGVSLEAAKAAVPTQRASSPQGGASFQDALSAAQTGSSATSYTVRSGDNLTRICHDRLQELGNDASGHSVWLAVQRVAQANDLKNANLIHPGQELDLSALDAQDTVVAESVPVEKAAEPATTAAATEETPEQVQPDFQTYAALLYGNLPTGLEELQGTPEFLPLTPGSATGGPQMLEGMGPFSEMGAPDDFVPASVELDRAIKLMDAFMEREQSDMGTIQAASPWSNLLSESAHLTSEFGIRRDPLTRRWEHHEGIDLAAPVGSEIKSFKDGEVVFSGWQSGYGRTVIVRHDDGLETVYGHNSKNLVNVGERVTAETPIAEVGSTGRSTGPHLHFEVRKNGNAIDPIPFLAPTPQAEVVAQAS